MVGIGNRLQDEVVEVGTVTTFKRHWYKHTDRKGLEAYGSNAVMDESGRRACLVLSCSLLVSLIVSTMNAVSCCRTLISWVPLACWRAAWSVSPAWWDQAGTIGSCCATLHWAWFSSSSSSTTCSPGCTPELLDPEQADYPLWPLLGELRRTIPSGHCWEDPPLPPVCQPHTGDPSFDRPGNLASAPWGGWGMWCTCLHDATHTHTLVCAATNGPTRTLLDKDSNLPTELGTGSLPPTVRY